MLGYSLSGSCSALSEHGWKIRCLSIDILLAACPTRVAFEGVRVNYGLYGGATLVHHVVGCSEITFFKRILCGAVAGQNVMFNATFPVNHQVVVILVLTLLLDHLARLWCVVIHSC